MAVSMGNSNKGKTVDGEYRNFNDSNQSNWATEQPKDEKVILSKESIEQVRETYSLSPVQQRFREEILASGEVDKLTSQIDITNNNTILEFGKDPAQKISQVADQVLSKYNLTQLQDTSRMVDQLLEVMKQIDIEEIKSIGTELEDNKKKKKSFFGKVRESAEDKLNRLVGKYKTVGSEMENICKELAVYEQQIKDSNKDIEKMYEQAKINYKTLETYVVAGEQAIKEIEEYMQQKQDELNATGDPDLNFEIQTVQQALTLMEQRVADLRTAETVALQSIPTFKIQEYTNSNLARKVNSAFIVTIPAFKTALVNSVIAKQQSIQIQGLSALDEATSALIRKNAENAAKQLQNSQRMANSSAIKADDIEYSWNVLMNAITQYKEMEVQYREIRKEESRRIEEINGKYLEMLSQGKAI